MKQYIHSSLSELKNNVAMLQPGDYCSTLGYYTAMDGGNANYLIVSHDTIIEDDGYIIRLTKSLIAVLIIENNEINALQYGAHRNWSQYPNEPLPNKWKHYDNKNIFNKLMLKAKELQCNVYIPQGVYMCNPTKVGDILLPMYSGITLRGDGQKTIITLPTIDESISPRPYYSPILHCVSISDFRVKDITFDGNRHLKSDGTYFGGNGMYGVFGAELTSIHNAIFENVTCQNTMYVGFRMWDVHKLNFNFCSCYSVDCGFISLGELEISDLTISNCYVDGHSKSEGISLYNKSMGENINIISNIIKNKSDGIGILIGNQDAFPAKKILSNYSPMPKCVITSIKDCIWQRL